MSDRRAARLNEQFKREISDILRRETRDPRIGAPTVTGVDATPDLWSARVYVRPGPEREGEEADQQLLDGLEAATPFVRRELGQRLTLRRVPELRFELDRTLEKAMRIEALLREVLPSDDAGEAQVSESSEDDGEGPEGSDSAREARTSGDPRE